MINLTRKYYLYRFIVYSILNYKNSPFRSQITSTYTPSARLTHTVWSKKVLKSGYLTKVNLNLGLNNRRVYHSVNLFSRSLLTVYSNSNHLFSANVPLILPRLFAVHSRLTQLLSSLSFTYIWQILLNLAVQPLIWSLATTWGASARAKFPRLVTSLASTNNLINI